MTEYNTAKLEAEHRLKTDADLRAAINGLKVEKVYADAFAEGVLYEQQITQRTRKWLVNLREKEAIAKSWEKE